MASIRATMPGYARRRKRYFYVVRERNAQTPGLILLDLTLEDFAALDRYEQVPRLYTRTMAEVLDAAGIQRRCWAYVPTTALLVLSR